MASLEVTPYPPHRLTTIAVVTLPRNLKPRSPRTLRHPVVITSFVIAIVNLFFALFLLILWMHQGVSVSEHTGELWYNYTVSCQEPKVAIMTSESGHVDAVNVFKSVYPPDSGSFTLESNTCQAFGEPNLDSVVWICNYEQSETEFAPDQVLDILTNVLLVNPCSYAGMDIEFQSGQKHILIQANDPNATEITNGPGGGTVSNFRQRDVNRLGDGCFEDDELPNIDDCTGMLNTMSQSSTGTYYFRRYDIMTFVHNTCVMYLASSSSDEISVDKKEMVKNVTAQIIPCLINGFLGRIWDMDGVEIQLRHVEQPIW